MKPLIVLAAALSLAGCSAKPVSPDYFGSAERVQAALANPDIPVLIGEFGTLRPNSAGGVDVKIEFKNTSEKPIKYLEFWLSPYNNVGDKVHDRIGRDSTAIIRYTGPLGVGKTNTFVAPLNKPSSNTIWRNTWYNHTIKCATIDKIAIEYMDNSTQTISDTALLLTRSGYCRRYD